MTALADSPAGAFDRSLEQRLSACRGEPDPVGAGDLAWANGRGLTYDQTNRALAKLVKRGVLRKPTRGHYLPVAVEAPDA